MLMVMSTQNVLLHAGVVAMFGSTYTGQYEDVEAFDAKVGESLWHTQPLSLKLCVLVLVLRFLDTFLGHKHCSTVLCTHDVILTACIAGCCEQHIQYWLLST